MPLDSLPQILTSRTTTTTHKAKKEWKTRHRKVKSKVLTVTDLLIWVRSVLPLQPKKSSSLPPLCSYSPSSLPLSNQKKRPTAPTEKLWVESIKIINKTRVIRWVFESHHPKEIMTVTVAARLKTNTPGPTKQPSLPQSLHIGEFFSKI